MSLFYAFTIRVGGRIKEIDGFLSETDADSFGIETTRYGELDPIYDPPDFYDKYDPPIVLVVEVETSDDLQSGKYKRPVAIFQRGEKWACVLSHCDSLQEITMEHK